MERVLVTGCRGFVGKTLVGSLLEEGFEVWGADRESTAEAFPGERYIASNLSDSKTVGHIFNEVKPDFIVHLAAQSSAGRSFDEPLETIENNVLPTLYILDAMKSGSPGVRLLAVGSAEEYGPAAREDLPLKESFPTNPVNPYALSKVIQCQCCLNYYSLYSVDVVVTRSFNHTGPGQRDTFVLASFAKQVAEIREGIREPAIEVGDLEVRRDFLDVDDVARAYIALLRRGKKGEVYNVCSGNSYRLRDLLVTMCNIAGVRVDIRPKKERMRPVDTEELRGDNSKIKKDTGWSPRIPIEKTLERVISYWLGEVGGESQGGAG